MPPLKESNLFYESMCRFCLGAGTGSIYNYNPELGGRTIVTFLETFTLIKMDFSTRCPSKICNKCLNTLTSFYNFIEHCETTEAVLLKWQSETNKIVESISALKNDNHSYPVESVDVTLPNTVEMPDSDLKIKCNDYTIENVEIPPVEVIDEHPQLFECFYCMKAFKRKAYLRKHMKTVHLDQPDGGFIVCSVCGKLIKGHDNVKTHIRTVHNKKLKSCSVCHVMLSAKALSTHMASHGENASKGFLCNLCGRVLKSMKSLERHEKIHKNIRDFVCTQCGATFAMKINLNAHVRRHSGVPPKLFPCDLCDKVFRGQHTLKRHQLWHSGIKPFSCKLCDKSFYARNELKTHERQHQEKAAKECVYCGKMFWHVTRLRLHIMAHKNIRPHTCEYCGKGFILRRKLFKHLVARHKIKSDNLERPWRDPKTYLTLNQLLEL